nr:MAG TPA: hypothetical protein [Bacteriophage sp.]
MQYRVYDRQTIAYVDGGFVASYEIDDDYIVNNNTTITLITPTTAMPGDIIVLIKTTGAYHKGVITEVDNSALKISYKADKELFNDNFPNPFSSAFEESTDEKNPVAGKFGVAVVAEILQLIYGRAKDTFKRLPLTVVTQGDVLDADGNVRMLWTWQDLSINAVDWFIDLFEKYNVVVSWTIDFDTSIANPQERSARYIVTVSAVTNNGGIIKDNVAMQTITYTGEQSFEQTACILVDSESKAMLVDGQWYLYQYPDREYHVLPTPNGIFSRETVKLETPKKWTDSITELETDLGYYIDGFEVNVLSYSCNSHLVTPTVTKGVATGTKIKFSVTWDKSVFLAKPVTITIEYHLVAKWYNTPQRVLPVKTKIVEYSTDDSNDITPVSAATETLVPSKYNQAVEVKINADSHMFDFALAQFGNEYTIVGKYVRELRDQEMTVVSIYTGRKESSKNKYVTLLFGLGRKQYTDLMQIRLRKRRYKSVYGR